ncbi:MBOAT family O-acyltransferase [Brucella sp. BE17]|uniref:MBOAT family O-acyltransferase n=1 Tax=Brucella sp. BE17 TaxID=3142977 RepID=UPI0031BB7376
MVFASNSFLFLFLPVFFLAYWFAPASLRNTVILLFSWLFYAWWRADFLALIVGIAVWSWTTGLWITRAQGTARKWALFVGIIGPLLSLIVFKYANLLVDTAGGVGVPVEGWVRIALPIGLSFFVFGAISYSVDVYRNTVSSEHSFINYATYQSMFGHLVAGPVVRYKWVAERLAQRIFDRTEFSLGVERFMLGFAQKVLLADTLAPMVDAGYSLSAPTTLDVTLTVIAYTMQLYFDFAGYSSMAIGLGLMVGLKFPENFNNPYLATSLSDFWRRWHISLSSWLRDYLYIPLGGSRQGETRTSVNMLITMALGGLWHGASWTFLVWGVWHGAGQAIARLWSNWRRSDTAPMPDATAKPRPVVALVASYLLTMLFVMVGWALFRAGSWEEFAIIARGFGGMHGFDFSGAFLAAFRPSHILALVLGAIVIYAPLFKYLKWQPWPDAALLKAAAAFPLWLAALWILGQRNVIPFLYFQF